MFVIRLFAPLSRFFWLLFFAALLTFALQNLVPVPLQFFPGIQFQAPLALICLSAFLCGWFGHSIVRAIGKRIKRNTPSHLPTALPPPLPTPPHSSADAQQNVPHIHVTQ